MHYIKFTGVWVTAGLTEGTGIHLGLHKFKWEQNRAFKPEKKKKKP